MPVIDVQEQWVSRSASKSKKGKRIRKRVYRVVTDDPNDAPDVIEGAPGIPDIGDVYGGVVFSGKSSEVGPTPTIWFVTVDYETPDKSDADSAEGMDENGELDEDPTARPDEISYQDSITQETWYFDETTPNALPYANSAGDPFEDLPSRDFTVGTIQIVRNSSSFNDADAELLRNLVNSSSVIFNGVTYAAGTLKVQSINAERQFENDILFWRITILIDKDPRGFNNFAVQDRGFYDINGLEKLDKAGNRHKTAWPLDGAGIFKANKTDAPAILNFKPYKEGSYLPINSL